MQSQETAAGCCRRVGNDAPLSALKTEKPECAMHCARVLPLCVCVAAARLRCRCAFVLPLRVRVAVARLPYRGTIALPLCVCVVSLRLRCRFAFAVPLCVCVAALRLRCRLAFALPLVLLCEFERNLNWAERRSRVARPSLGRRKGGSTWEHKNRVFFKQNGAFLREVNRSERSDEIWQIW